MAEKKEALVKWEQQYPVLATGQSAALDILHEHVDPEDVNLFDLPKIKINPGGANTFSIDGAEGVKTANKVQGVIVLRRKMRAYWPEGDSLGGPPACFSDDGKVGYGMLAGDTEAQKRYCRTCPMARFNSAKRGGKPSPGQACQLRNVLFLLLPGQSLPTILSAPPTSARSVQNFIIGLAAASKHPYEVVTNFGLEKKKNSAGQDYSVLTINSVGALNEDFSENAAKLHGAFKKLFSNTRMTGDDVEALIYDEDSEGKEE